MKSTIYFRKYFKAISSNIFFLNLYMSCLRWLCVCVCARIHVLYVQMFSVCG